MLMSIVCRAEEDRSVVTLHVDSAEYWDLVGGSRMWWAGLVCGQVRMAFEAVHIEFPSAQVARWEAGKKALQ